MSNPRYGSGRKQFVGQGIEADLSKLDPAAYTGAVAYSDGELYYSDGSEWVVPQDEVDIARPRNLAPTTSTEQSQLRLTAFRSPTGETQTGIIFEINTDGLPQFGEGANLITRNVTSEVASLYQVVYPDDGFEPGETIWWRARYLGTNSSQSQYSIPTAQAFPDLITTPSPITPAFAITGTVTATAYDSPAIFSLAYLNTNTEFYVAGAVPGVDAPAATVTQTTGATTTIPSGLTAGTSYYWRTRYSGRVGVGSPTVTSAWSVLRGVVAGGPSMLLEYNLDLASARTIGVPLAGTVNVTVNWGDGITETFTTAGVKTHTYASGFGPTVLVTITGSMTAYGNGTITAAQQQGLTRVENWGFGLGLTSLAAALYRTSANLVYVSPTLPETVTNLTDFMGAATSNPDISALDTSNVTNMTQMFFGNGDFNRSIGGWNTSKVTTMNRMFRQAAAFNQPIGTWDVSKVTDFSEMFQQATVFNQNIGAWNTVSATSMLNMFFAATGFNNGGSATINNWNVSNVTNMQGMFGSGGTSSVFNQPIGSWNVGKVTNMVEMFKDARAFQQNINTWNVSTVTNMTGMFSGSNTSVGSLYNQPLNNWNVSNVTNMSSMFLANTSFNQNISSWNVANVTNMNSMFSVCAAFNQNIGAWNTGNVTNMANMFNGTSVFNNGGSPDINNWNVSKVTIMDNMFSSAVAFNQPIGNWNTSALTSVLQMFGGALVFNQDIGSWNLSNVSNFNFFLGGPSGSAPAFNRSLGGWILRPAGTSMPSFGGVAINEENYSRTLIGWANYVATTDGPYAVTFAPAATRLYNANNYVPGARFTNATAARAFLVGGRIVSVTGASDANANTTYTYNGTTQTYDAANGWKFAVLGSAWGLYNASAVLQATGTGGAIGTGPHTVTSWTGVLSAATVLRTGAGWTITGDAAA
jgi:surface protein